MKNCATYYNISNGTGKSFYCAYKSKLSSSNLRGSRVVMLIILLWHLSEPSNAQDRQNITLPQAIDIGLKNYPSIKAKQNYVHASENLTRNARNEYLPNVIASVQQSYGTINGQFGPGGSIGVLGVASSGPVTSQQNWDAAFGGLYILSTNWEAFTFGRIHSRVQLGVAQQKQNSADLEQEIFVHSVRIAGAYLNLLIAHQLLESSKSNLGAGASYPRKCKGKNVVGFECGC